MSVLSFNRALEDSRRDGCHLLRDVVILATPHGRLAQALTFLQHSPLRDCNHYAENPGDASNLNVSH